MAAASPNRGEKRRAEILKTALALFNARDTGSVSTNHIAASLAISVGNLYWHFRDKEAIVRALYEEHDRKFDGAWARPSNESDAIDAAIAGLRRVFALTWEYRFLYRELASLTRADPELRKMHAATRARRRGELRRFQNAFRELGVLQVPDDETLERLDELTWIVTSFWLAHVELRDGALTRRAVEDGASAVLGLFLPYATARHARALTSALDANRRRERG